MAIKRNAQGKIVPKKFSVARLEKCAALYIGLCRACGAEHEKCEGDARKIQCKSCNLPAVYGAEELALMMMF